MPLTPSRFAAAALAAAPTLALLGGAAFCCRPAQAQSTLSLASAGRYAAAPSGSLWGGALVGAALVLPSLRRQKQKREPYPKTRTARGGEEIVLGHELLHFALYTGVSSTP